MKDSGHLQHGGPSRSSSLLSLELIADYRPVTKRASRAAGSPVSCLSSSAGCSSRVRRRRAAQPDRVSIRGFSACAGRELLLAWRTVLSTHPHTSTFAGPRDSRFAARTDTGGC